MTFEAKPLNILLVEDEETDVQITQHVCEKSSLSAILHIVGDGEAALDFVFHRGAYQDSSRYPFPDIIFLDIGLPNINGFEVLKQIKSDGRLNAIPVVMLTGSKEDEDAFKSVSDGAVSYIQKPVTGDQFHKVIDGFNRYSGRPEETSSDNP